MNWKGYGRMWSWANETYYPSICLDGLMKIGKTLMKAGLRAEICTGTCQIRIRIADADADN
jgi:hypothetical protein